MAKASKKELYDELTLKLSSIRSLALVGFYGCGDVNGADVAGLLDVVFNTAHDARALLRDNCEVFGYKGGEDGLES